MEKLIKSKIREIPDWPKKGVNFKDITPLIEDSKAFRKIIDAMAKPYLGRPALTRRGRPALTRRGRPALTRRGRPALTLASSSPRRSGRRGRPALTRRGRKIDKIVGIDARGFIIAAALAYKLKSGVAIVRKKGKLPLKKVSKKYALEYGSNTIEMHKDTILAGEKVLLVDDLLATGGTMAAAIDLVKKLKGKIISVDFLIELTFLNGRKKLKGYKIRSLAKYSS